MAERGIEVNHVTISRWLQRFTPLFIDVARQCRHSPGDHWFVDATYLCPLAYSSPAHLSAVLDRPR